MKPATERIAAGKKVPHGLERRRSDTEAVGTGKQICIAAHNEYEPAIQLGAPHLSTVRAAARDNR